MRRVERLGAVVSDVGIVSSSSWSIGEEVGAIGVFDVFGSKMFS